MSLAGLKVPRKTFVNDLVSGLVMAAVTVPGALANGLLAGVNPVYGVYSVIAGTSVAALFTSSVIMNVDSTSATSIATGNFVGAVVILRLRDRDEVGSTFIRAIERYGQQLQARDNRLMLEGLNERVLEQLEETDILDLIGEENVFLAQARFGAALAEALAAAETWVAEEGP